MRMAAVGAAAAAGRFLPQPTHFDQQVTDQFWPGRLVGQNAGRRR